MAKQKEGPADLEVQVGKYPRELEADGFICVVVRDGKKVKLGFTDLSEEERREYIRTHKLETIFQLTNHLRNLLRNIYIDREDEYWDNYEMDELEDEWWDYDEYESEEE